MGLRSTRTGASRPPLKQPGGVAMAQDYASGVYSERGKQRNRSAASKVAWAPTRHRGYFWASWRNDEATRTSWATCTATPPILRDVRELNP